MISDFGTSEEMLRGKRERTGHTGTMEYMVSWSGPGTTSQKAEAFHDRLPKPWSSMLVAIIDHPTRTQTCGHWVGPIVVAMSINSLEAGMILHKLLFLHLPYSQTDDFGDLQTEIVAYPG